MLAQILVAGAASVCNITIHALIMAVVMKIALAGAANISLSYFSLSRIMIAIVSVFMFAHTTEVFVWTFFYWLTEANIKGDLLYFALVNYTTLGYGDVTPVQRWQLLGPLTAMNGILLFGWSTAVIFEVLQKALARMDVIASPPSEHTSA